MKYASLSDRELDDLRKEVGGYMDAYAQAVVAPILQPAFGYIGNSTKL